MTVDIPGIGKCDVLERCCAMRACLRPGRYTHRSAAGASGCSSWTDDRISCLTRDNNGCPPVAERTVADERSFHVADCSGFVPDAIHEMFLYGHNVRATRGWIRCTRCRQMVPRAAIVESRRGPIRL